MHQTRHNIALSLWIILSVAGFSARQSLAQDNSRQTNAHLDGRGFVQIDGVPRLVIGLYELPKDDSKLKEIAENGFNIVRVPQDAGALDRVHRFGLHAWICLGSAIQINEGDAQAGQELATVVDKFKGHPALLVWELPDEALWSIWWGKTAWVSGGQQKELRKHIEAVRANTADATIARWNSLLAQADDYDDRGLWKQAEEIYSILWAELKVDNPHPAWKMSQCPAESRALIEASARGCELVRRLDPAHPLWQNHAPRNSTRSLLKYNEMVDAAGCDIYPAPPNYDIGHSDLRDTLVTSVGAYTDRMREAAPGKSVWMVLQGFGWRDLSEGPKGDADPAKGRRPHFAETRFMAYDAIVHGANAILYWGTASIEDDCPLWRDIMKVARELRALEPGIVGGRAAAEPVSRADETYGSVDDEGPRLMLRRAGNDWVLIAVNEYGQGVSFSVSNLPKEIEGKTLYRLYSDETQVVRDGGLHDGIRHLGVHVYATSRRFEAR
ncbi:MAG: hypothetical protein ABFE13_01295 [Phycisphaerales bacterium]